MEDTRSEQAELVRCLDCGTVYSRPVRDDDAGPCPTCGYVGWIVLRVEEKTAETDS